MVKAGDYYAEGGATEAYCNRAVCPSVCLLQAFLVARWKLSAETSNTSWYRCLLECIDRTFVRRLVREL